MIGYNNHFPNNNNAVSEDYLEELIRILGKERGNVPVPQSEGGYMDVELKDGAVISLTVPEEAVSALVMIEADPESERPNRILRFKENGSDPTLDSGFSLGDNDVYHICGHPNLKLFRAIGIDATKIHWIRIQFFKTIARN